MPNGDTFTPSMWKEIEESEQANPNVKCAVDGCSSHRQAGWYDRPGHPRQPAPKLCSAHAAVNI